MGIKFQNKLITSLYGCKGKKKKKKKPAKTASAPPYYALGMDGSPLILQGLDKNVPPLPES